MDEMLDISPEVNLLRSLRGTRINYVKLAGEGIDNAFDAGAHSVRLYFDEQEIVFEDDGRGIDKKRIANLFKLGGHSPMITTALGRFGIGIKSHAVNVGDVLRVKSTSVDGRVRAAADWREVLRGGNWKIPAPHWTPVAVGTPTGTALAISGLRRAPTISYDTIADEIELRFYPALADGRRIYFNGREIVRPPEPSMSDVVDTQLALSGARRAHLRGGLLTRPAKLNRVHIGYEHRIIMPASTFGCGTYSGLTKMFARVQLSGPWHLAQYKDDLTDEGEREELEQAVEEALTPILEKCSNASMSARLNEFAHLLNEMLPSNLTSARPKRVKEEDPTPATKKRVRHERGTLDADKATTDPSGPARTRKTARLMITFEGNDKDHGLGEFVKGRPNRVNLSPDNATVARMMEHRDKSVGAHSLYVIALAIYEEGRAASLGTADLFSFGQRVASLLAMQDENEMTAMTGSAR